MRRRFRKHLRARALRIQAEGPGIKWTTALAAAKKRYEAELEAAKGTS